MPYITSEHAGAEISNSNEGNMGIKIKVPESHPECHFKVHLCSHRCLMQFRSLCRISWCTCLFSMACFFLDHVCGVWGISSHSACLTCLSGSWLPTPYCTKPKLMGIHLILDFHFRKEKLYSGNAPGFH